MRARLAISFSGGRSSAVMARMCLRKYAETHDMLVTFANTGCEHEATLEFVRDCDANWKFQTVWLEAVIGPEGVGPKSKVVAFDTASRNGEPFEAAIAKHGIFNPMNKHCTARLKTDVMDHYRHKVIGWEPGSYDTAIGIRADESDRMSAKRKERRFVYPLVEAGINKSQIDAIMGGEPFDLKLPGDHYGNCVWCWKKSLRKLMTIAKTDPQAFDFPRRMEERYGEVMPPEMKAQEFWQGKSRVFFR